MIPMLIMGIAQRIFEWLPVSSQGMISTLYSFFFDKSYQESIQFALWLHIGTVPSVMIIFRRMLLQLGSEFIRSNHSYSPQFKFFVISTLVSAPIGFGILIGLDELTKNAGNFFMVFVGVAMSITGIIQLRHKVLTNRVSNDLNLIDGVTAGIAQGFSVIPGFSRSGMTISVLTLRGMDRREVLSLSFIMGIPVSLGAALWIGITQGFTWSIEAVLSALVAFLVGLATINILLSVSTKINLGAFIIIVGLIMIAGGLITTL